MTMINERSLAVPHVIKGQAVLPTSPEAGVSHRGFFTPRLDLDELVWLRDQPGPAFDLSTEEVIEYLLALGAELNFEKNDLLQEAYESSVKVNDLGARILGIAYRGLPALFDRASLEFQVDQEVGRDVLDGWAELTDPAGRTRRVRAFPPRLVHVLAGNTPGVTAITVVRAALTKGVHLLKLPSNDLFTASAILRTMERFAPNHPITQSFSCVYWRGGDTTVESAVFRSQYFDKLVAWGGDAAIRSALSYIGPGFELVAFDPKVSISIVGRGAFADEHEIAESARRAAIDVSLYNQAACASSRFIYVECERGPQLDDWCKRLAQELGVDRPVADGTGVPVPEEVRDEVDMLRNLAPMFSVWGDFEHGTVIQSDDPVDFHPEGKVVNVIPIESLDEVLQYVNVATQTIGIYPPQLSPELRNRLASRGMQRIVPLGEVLDHIPGMPHDGFYPLHRFVRWLIDDC
jgi:Acyl-CoA reductase (LuxC)